MPQPALALALMLALLMSSSAPGRRARVPASAADSTRVVPNDNTHQHQVEQMGGGLYGPLLVLEPGHQRDTTTDRVYVRE